MSNHKNTRAMRCSYADLNWKTEGVRELVDLMWERGLFKLNPTAVTLEAQKSKRQAQAWHRNRVNGRKARA